MPNRFIRGWLLEKYRDVIEDAVAAVTGVRPVEIAVVICGQLYQKMREEQKELSSGTAGPNFVSSAPLPEPQPVVVTQPEAFGAQASAYKQVTAQSGYHVSASASPDDDYRQQPKPQSAPQARPAPAAAQSAAREGDAAPEE